MPRIFNARYLFFGSEEIQQSLWETPDNLAPVTVVCFKTPGMGGQGEKNQTQLSSCFLLVSIVPAAKDRISFGASK